MGRPATTSCPYCDRNMGSRGALRLHLSTDACGLVPGNVVLEAVTEDLEALEATFENEVATYAERHGWLVCKPDRGRGRDGRWMTNTRKSGKGFPDLVLVRPPLVLFLECKTEVGRTSPEQRRWVNRLQRCNRVEAYVVRPADWPALEATMRPPG